MKKYIEFDSIADLTSKLEKLINYRERSLLDSRKWFLQHNIPYEVLPNGDLGVDLSKLDSMVATTDLGTCSKNTIIEKFKEKQLHTQQYYQELGVVFVEDITNITPINLNYSLRQHEN